VKTFGGVTSALGLVIIFMVILSATDSANTGAAGYLSLAYSAFAVVLAAVLVGAFVFAAFGFRYRLGLLGLLGWFPLRSVLFPGGDSPVATLT
jgi:hypothetical protein